MYYGYSKRTGKRGDFKHWYFDDISKKYYECIKPSDYVIRRSKIEVNHPHGNQIMPCPWKNLESSNFELIETNECVLFNYGGIIDKKEMDSFENFYLILLINELINEIYWNTTLSIELIKQWHQRFLGQLYPWAGKYRTVDICKYGFRWPSYTRIHDAMLQLENEYLNNTPIESNDENEIFSFIASVIGELLFIHPFREGNGRIAKLVGAILFFQKGYPFLDFSLINKTEWINASLDAYGQNYNSLELLLKRALKIE